MTIIAQKGRRIWRNAVLAELDSFLFYAKIISRGLWVRRAEKLFNNGEKGGKVMAEKNPPLSADEIIAGLGKRKLRKNTYIIIKILSAEMMTREELAKRLRREPAYDCQESTNKHLKDRAEGLRRFYGILGCQDARCFVINSKADPKFQDNVARNFGKKSVRGRALRSIIYEILKKKPLVVGPLARAIENHPDYDGSKGAGKELKKAINWILTDFRNRESFFERDKSRGRYNVWLVKENSNSPPRKTGRYRYKRRDAFYRLMRSQAVIKGWSFDDLFEATRQSALGYNSLKTARCAFRNLFRQNEDYFQQSSLKNPVRWRAKWLGPLKTPSCPKDFLDLAGRILDDLMVPQNLEDLLGIIRQFSHLFGYQTNELPLIFLENGVVGAIAGTKYASLIL